MGWFNRLLGRSSNRPTVVELVPGKLTARVYAHNFPVRDESIPCWTYVTQGFLAHGQKEFVFTLVCGLSDDPTGAPRDPIQFFTQIYSLAEQKKIVDAGGYTRFQPRTGTFLGVTGMVGFAYTQPEPLPGVDLPPTGQFLNAIFLLPGEAEMVQAGWLYRVLSRLGREAQYYPHPPWSNPRREPVFNRDQLSGCLLSKMPTAHLNGAFVRMYLARREPHEDMRGRAVGGSTPETKETDTTPLSKCEHLLLRIHRDRLPEVREILSHVTGTEGAFALLLDADPEADMRLTWLPGDVAPSTLTPTPNASCLTGGFLAVAFGPHVSEGGRISEDGFSFLLKPALWLRLRDALTNGEPITLLEKPGHLALSVEWIK